MNNFKLAMSKKANGPIIDKEIYAFSTNPKAVKPIINKFLGPLYKVHYTTTNKLKMFNATTYYAMNFNLIKVQSRGTNVLYDGDDVKKLADDSLPMIMRIRAEDLTIRNQVLKEYSIASWVSAEAQNNIIKLALDGMSLDIIQVISQDRCFLFYKSKFHGNERLKVQYYYRTRKLIFDVEE